MSNTAPPRPRAFRLEGQPQTHAPMVEEQADAFAALEDKTEAATELAQARGFMHRGWRWAGLFWSALGGLLTLSLGLWLTHLVESLFASSPLLGALGLALAGLALSAALVLLVREVLAISRQRKIADIHAALAHAHATDSRAAAHKGLASLLSLYALRAETARARATIAGLMTEIIDGRDLIDLAERNLMLPLDAQARRVVAQAARRVSMVTTISPRAVFDVVFVAAQIIWLLRKIAEIYGGRPGLLGFFRLLRAVGTHLAITGGMALGDSLVQQLVGHGIAAKLSAKLGESVLNGLLTARVGIAAISVCRPMPFAIATAPGVQDVVPDLFSGKIAKPSDVSL